MFGDTAPFFSKQMHRHTHTHAHIYIYRQKWPENILGQNWHLWFRKPTMSIHFPDLPPQKRKHHKQSSRFTGGPTTGNMPSKNPTQHCRQILNRETISDMSKIGRTCMNVYDVWTCMVWIQTIPLACRFLCLHRGIMACQPHSRHLPSMIWNCVNGTSAFYHGEDNIQ